MSTKLTPDQLKRIAAMFPLNGNDPFSLAPHNLCVEKQRTAAIKALEEFAQEYIKEGFEAGFKRGLAENNKRQITKNLKDKK